MKENIVILEYSREDGDNLLTGLVTKEAGQFNVQVRMYNTKDRKLVQSFEGLFDELDEATNVYHMKLLVFRNKYRA